MFSDCFSARDKERLHEGLKQTTCFAHLFKELTAMKETARAAAAPADYITVLLRTSETKSEPNSTWIQVLGKKGCIAGSSAYRKKMARFLPTAAGALPTQYRIR